MTGLLLFALIVLLLALRVGIVPILLAAGLYAQLAWGGSPEFMVQDIWATMEREQLLAIPLFLLVGSLMARGSIAQRLVNVIVELTKPVPGGLALATILSCTLFSAISGSSIVTMLAVGSVLYPALLANGYSKSFSIGALVAGGSLGIVIPPSVPMIIFGIVTESSIADLFIAGVGPGLLLAGAFSAYAVFVNRRMPRQTFSPREFLQALRQGIPALLMPVILLGGIYSGHFSPLEAGAVACGYAVLVELLWYREMNFSQYMATTIESAKLIGSLFLLLALAMSLTAILVEHRVPDAVVAFAVEHIKSPWAFILMVNVLLIALGLFLETGPAIIITAPLLVPLAQAYGFSPTHLGIIMILNLEIGMLTPPMGMNLIVAMTAFKENYGLVCRAAIPWILIMLACLALVVWQPWIALGLVK